MGAVTDWTFDGTWPFEPRWFESPDGRMHYVDVGPPGGRPVVMVHGNPTWGYLYRNFIPALVDAGHRAIVPDHLGFGRSDLASRALCRAETAGRPFRPFGAHRSPRRPIATGGWDSSRPLVRAARRSQAASARVFWLHDPARR